MKIKYINDERIEFENGLAITFRSCNSISANNYADFKQLDDVAKDTDFDLEHLVFEEVPESGFRFGNIPNKMFFVPCYSEQNGWYSEFVDILFGGKEVLCVESEMVVE